MQSENLESKQLEQDQIDLLAILNIPFSSIRLASNSIFNYVIIIEQLNLNRIWRDGERKQIVVPLYLTTKRTSTSGFHEAVSSAQLLIFKQTRDRAYQAFNALKDKQYIQPIQFHPDSFEISPTGQFYLTQNASKLEILDFLKKATFECQYDEATNFNELLTHESSDLREFAKYKLQQKPPTTT